jgi:hypothetical protein
VVAEVVRELQKLLRVTGQAGELRKDVRGYKVRTTSAVIDSEEAERRRNAVAAVIARSLRETNKE